MSHDSNLVQDGNRKFHDLPTSSTHFDPNNEKKTKEESENLLQFISNDVIGKDYQFDGPFGKRWVTYCDYTASGRALSSIEQYINEKILSAYGNTHTTTTVTSLQSSMFLQEARMMIRNAVRANEHDAVIFVGNGVTGAVNKLIHAIDFKQPPVVFVGPFEHHSNLLPWREIASHVVYISEDKDGHINLKHLEMALKSWKSVGVPLVGCFSAASNVTGVVSDTVAVSALLHQYGCLSMWDYATAGPYLDIDMHPHNAGDASKDAVFLSMHKFVGGVDCPGVLIAKKSLFRSKIPSECGGGAVFFVARDHHRYLQDVEMREEAGTIRVVGAVRSALAIKLKQSVGVDTIKRMEMKYRRKAVDVWREIPQMKILGDYHNDEHLAIFSFLVADESSGKYLHHNYVATLLNDLFGIQARGGCACAGPYAQHLLGIDTKLANIYEQVLLEDSRLDRTHLRRQSEYSQNEILRPGFTRINLPYFSSDEEVDYVIKAVTLVARHGWMLLPQYMFNPETGEWHHIKHKIFSDRRWIEHTTFTCEGLKVTDPKSKYPAENMRKSYQQLLDEGSEILQSAGKGTDLNLPDHSQMFSDLVQPLLWFLLPSEALKRARKQETQSVKPAIFHPATQPQLLTTEEMQQSSSIPSNFQLLPVEQKTTVEVKDKVKEEEEVASSEELACLMGKCVLKRREAKPEKDQVTTASKYKFVNPPKSLMKPSIEAMEKFKMINDGDRVLVCLSGGKDSLSLLHVLHQYQFCVRSKGINFQLGAVTVDPMTSSYDPSPLIGYLAQLGVTYFYERQAILDEAMKLSKIKEISSICSFCSRMKRGRLYACARREGWNVLAFGQHLDDLAETFLMSSFHNGNLYTMKANYFVEEDPTSEMDLRVIRPFVFIRETQTRDFAESNKLPVIPENCPACFEAPKERHRVKQLLAAQEILHPNIFHNLKTAMEPLMGRGFDEERLNGKDDGKEYGRMINYVRTCLQNDKCSRIKQ